MSKTAIRFLCILALVVVGVLASSLFGAHAIALLVVVGGATARLLVELFSSDTLRIRSIVTAIATYVGAATVYACVYFLLGAEHIAPPFSRDPTGVLEAVYFSFVTVTTLGYGDFKPCTPEAKAVVISQLIVGLLILAVGVNYVLTRKSTRT